MGNFPKLFNSKANVISNLNILLILPPKTWMCFVCVEKSVKCFLQNVEQLINTACQCFMQISPHYIEIIFVEVHCWGTKGTEGTEKQMTFWKHAGFKLKLSCHFRRGIITLSCLSGLCSLLDILKNNFLWQSWYHVHPSKNNQQ